MQNLHNLEERRIKMRCPKCTCQLDFIELIKDDEESKETAWNCDECNLIVYIHEMKPIQN